MVQGSTQHGTRQYRLKYNKVQGSTCWYMSVHGGLHLRRAGRGRGRGGRFWCAFGIAALTAPTVASASNSGFASSDCMHKFVYSSRGLGTLGPASPATVVHFGTRGRRGDSWGCRGRRPAFSGWRRPLWILVRTCGRRGLR